MKFHPEKGIDAMAMFFWAKFQPEKYDFDLYKTKAIFHFPNFKLKKKPKELGYTFYILGKILSIRNL